MSTQAKSSIVGDPEGLIRVIGGVLTLVAVLLVVLVVALSVPIPPFLSASGLAAGAAVFWLAFVVLLAVLFRVY
ncbi:MAG: hypothetical protein V5A46_05525 [Haloferacaceae archaeon]